MAKSTCFKQSVGESISTGDLSSILLPVHLDNARIHAGARVRECLVDWQSRGLYLFYLPLYSPHLNVAERHWKELKGRWLRPRDYQFSNSLLHAA